MKNIENLKDIEDLKDFVIATLKEKKADNIKVISLNDEVPLTNYMIFASGRSQRNVAAIADFLTIELKHKAGRNVAIEGLKNAEWVLIDIGDIIVHIFHPETREHYLLEEHWSSKSK